jgi:hypothetical protein
MPLHHVVAASENFMPVGCDDKGAFGHLNLKYTPIRGMSAATKETGCIDTSSRGWMIRSESKQWR